MILGPSPPPRNVAAYSHWWSPSVGDLGTPVASAWRGHWSPGFPANLPDVWWENMWHICGFLDPLCHQKLNPYGSTWLVCYWPIPKCELIWSDTPSDRDERLRQSYSQGWAIQLNYTYHDHQLQYQEKSQTNYVNRKTMINILQAPASHPVIFR